MRLFNHFVLYGSSMNSFIFSWHYFIMRSSSSDSSKNSITLKTAAFLGSVPRFMPRLFLEGVASLDSLLQVGRSCCSENSWRHLLWYMASYSRRQDIDSTRPLTSHDQAWVRPFTCRRTDVSNQVFDLTKDTSPIRCFLGLMIQFSLSSTCLIHTALVQNKQQVR